MHMILIRCLRDFSLIPFFAFALLLTAGCASLDRMNRMSGGIISEYIPPKSYRIRSEKYQKKQQEFASSTRANQMQLRGIDDNLINLWPLYFKSSDYSSFLWPMADFDAFGMAVRPFYNHEGDAYSILFPLSAWNPENRDGWVLNCFWNRNDLSFFPFGWYSKKGEGRILNWKWKRDGSSGLVPLTWQYENSAESLHYYFPFYRLKKKLNLDNWHVYHGRRGSLSSRTIFLPWIHKSTLAKDPGEWGPAYSLLTNVPGSRLENFLRYKCSLLGEKVPEHSRDWLADLWKTFPVREGNEYWLFPLFRYERFPLPEDGSRWRALAGLVGASKTKTPSSRNWDLLGKFLGEYSYRNLDDPVAQGCYGTESKFRSYLLLTSYEKRMGYPRTPALQALRSLREHAGSAPDTFQERRPEIKKLLETYPGAPELPETVQDGLTLRLFLNRLPPLEQELERKYLDIRTPLFSLHSAEDYHRFFSIPLLTYSYRDADSRKQFIAPLLWYSDKTSRDWHHCGVYSRNVIKTHRDWENVASENDYGFCGLYFHGKQEFNVVKPGFSEQNVQFVRNGIPNLVRKFTDLKRKERELEHLKQEKLAMDSREPETGSPEPRIQALEREIRNLQAEIKKERFNERFREKLTAFEKEKWETDQLLQELTDKGKSFGFDFSREALNENGQDGEIARLYDLAVEQRSSQDWGSLFFYKMERYWNKDYRWHFLKYIAGGSRLGEKESTHFLHFLYRHRKEGRKEETLFFPFVSIQRDGKDSEFSFFWRIFQRKVKDGKSSGYFLFIPWGT